MLFYLILFLIVAGLAWIRLAPADTADWHVDPQVTADQDLANGVRRRIDARDGTWQALNTVILATPRTELFAGGPDEDRATYVTRSQWMGFPDFTTIQRSEDAIELWSRSRFGKSDMGVNRARAEGWLGQLDTPEPEA